jgi:hypothetical protein
MSQAIVENVKMERMKTGKVRSAHPSKIAKGEAASFVVDQEWAGLRVQCLKWSVLWYR